MAVNQHEKFLLGFDTCTRISTLAQYWHNVLVSVNLKHCVYDMRRVINPLTIITSVVLIDRCHKE